MPVGTAAEAVFCYSGGMSMHDVARALLQDRKGILIADEGMNSGSKLFLKHNIAESPENYRKYRELIVRADGIEEILSAIAFPEDAFADIAADGTPLYDIASSKNILLGIAREGAGDGSGTFSKTLSRLKSSGAVFCMTRIARDADGSASDSFKQSIRDTIGFVKACHEAEYAALVAVDVSTDGPQTAAQAEDAITESLALLSDALESSGVDMKGIVVATSMAVSGNANPLRAAAPEVGDRTARAASSSLPETLSGVVFLSDSQGPEEATANMNAISRNEPLPWPVAFAFSDAFEDPVIAEWDGKDENVSSAQGIFLERLALAQAADEGAYSAGMELS